MFTYTGNDWLWKSYLTLSKIKSLDSLCWMNTMLRMFTKPTDFYVNTNDRNHWKSERWWNAGNQSLLLLAQRWKSGVAYEIYIKIARHTYRRQLHLNTRFERRLQCKEPGKRCCLLQWRTWRSLLWWKVASDNPDWNLLLRWCRHRTVPSRRTLQCLSLPLLMCSLGTAETLHIAKTIKTDVINWLLLQNNRIRSLVTHVNLPLFVISINSASRIKCDSRFCNCVQEDGWISHTVIFWRLISSCKIERRTHWLCSPRKMCRWDASIGYEKNLAF